MYNKHIIDVCKEYITAFSKKKKGENRREKSNMSIYKLWGQYTIKTISGYYAIEEREFLPHTSRVLRSTFVQLAEYKNEHRMY